MALEYFKDRLSMLGIFVSHMQFICIIAIRWYTANISYVHIAIKYRTFMKYSVGLLAIAVLGAGLWYALSVRHSTPAGTPSVRADGAFTIVTSFYPLQYAATRIVGDLGVVINISKGNDPHDFEPSAEDMLTLQKADVVVLQGADFEPWGDAVRERLEAEAVPVISATEGMELLPEEHSHEHEHEEAHEHGAVNPHTWVDPVRFSETVEHMAEALAGLDPENADIYLKNAHALKADLAALDAEYAGTLQSCALDEVITSHDAFGYVGERYGFKIHTIAGISTQDTPSLATMALLKEEASEGIGAILLEENNIKAFGETLARETGLKTLTINPIENVGESGDYLLLMRSNLSAFATALACNGY